MAQAVMYSRYGGPEVLELVDVAKPVAGAGEVVVEVMAAGLNPIETGIREGRFASERPARFPVGQGSDFAGFVADVGPGVTGWNPNDSVLGHITQGAQSGYVVVPAGNLIRKPEHLSWEVAGSLYVAASLAVDAVQAANPGPGKTVLVHAAAGGVGSIAAQLAKLRGATVIGTASPASFDYLRSWGVIPVEYGPGLEERLAAIAPDGIDTELEHVGDHVLPNLDSADNQALTRVAALVANRQIVMPVAAIYPLSNVQDAYRELEAGHAHGKIVLSMVPVEYARQKVHGIDMRETEATRDDPNRAPIPPAHEVLPPVFGHRHHTTHETPSAESRTRYM
ncbi:NADP-dependent oxidoreductase [Glaciibacter sp. 2TAF33]|uniref:NADP-dependent oxidoreductase n=1 Tax=Glaciibacter sp. 2TAF33 TaxID=3233015 RepID=UPI003F8FD642